MEKTPGKQRQSNFELLRIVAMVLIVSLHYQEFGFILPETQTVTANYLLLRFLGFGGHMAVDIFVLISGYFMVNQHFSMKKAIKLWVQTAFYALAFAVIFFAFGKAGLRDLADAFFAPANGMYWFITTYLLLYILSDFINVMIHALSREKLCLLIWIMLTVVSLLPTFLSIRPGASNLFLFVTLYIIGAYIRLYSPKFFESKRCLLYGVGFHWLCFIASAVLLAFREKIPVLGRVADRMSSVTDATIILSAVLIFAGFKNLKIKDSAFINTLAASAMGVYLIHANPFANHLIWVDILHTPAYLDSPILIVHALGSIAAVYISCTLIDLLYRRLVESLVMHLLNKRRSED